MFPTSHTAPELFSLATLYAPTERRNACKRRLYDTVLGRVLHRIKSSANFGNAFACTYEAPEMMVGEPLYDLYECCGYVVSKLRDMGFDRVEYRFPKEVYVNWETQYQKHQNARRDIHVAAEPPATRMSKFAPEAMAAASSPDAIVHRSREREPKPKKKSVRFADLPYQSTGDLFQ